MQIKETIDVSFPGPVESPLLDDIVVLVDSAGVALGVQRTFSARVRGVRDGSSGLITKCVEIPLIGSDGEVSGILCYTGLRSDTRGAGVTRGRESVKATADVTQSVVQDITNLLAVIGSGTLVRLFLPSEQAAELPSSIVDTEIAYTPSLNGGVFHVVNLPTVAPTS